MSGIGALTAARLPTNRKDASQTRLIASVPPLRTIDEGGVHDEKQSFDIKKTRYRKERMLLEPSFRVCGDGDDKPEGGKPEPKPGQGGRPKPGEKEPNPRPPPKDKPPASGVPGVD